MFSYTTAKDKLNLSVAWCYKIEKIHISKNIFCCIVYIVKVSPRVYNIFNVTPFKVFYYTLTSKTRNKAIAIII